jgi:hypothetical protein
MFINSVYACAAAFILSSCIPKSDSPANKPKTDSTQNLDGVPGTEMIRQIMSPCNLSQWKKDLEFQETYNYNKQGFSLVSVTPLVPDANGNYETSDNPNVEVKPALGSCRWIFVKRPGTSSPSPMPSEGSDLVSQWRSPCNLDHWDKEFNFDELQSMTKKGFSLVSATPIIGDQSGNFAGFPENTKPAPGSCFWTFALNPK